MLEPTTFWRRTGNRRCVSDASFPTVVYSSGLTSARPPSATAIRWIATCPDETKGVLASELVQLGVKDPRPIYRGVAFEADLETGYRAHLWLRTASRIQRRC